MSEQDGRSPRTGQIISLVALGVILALGAYYVSAHRERFAAILHVSPAGMLALACLTLATWSTQAFVLRAVTEELGAEISVYESHLLMWTARYWNYLPMRPGLYAQAVYMKLKGGLPYSRFLAYLIFANFVPVVVRSLAGLLLTAPMAIAGSLTPVIPLLFAAMLGGCAVLMAVPRTWAYSGSNVVLRALSRVGDAWHQLRGHRGLLARIAAWSVVQAVIGTCGLYLAYRLVGVPAGPGLVVTTVLISPITNVAAFIPAHLGASEALVGLVRVGFGGAMADGVVAATLGRAVRFCLAVVLGSLAAHRLLPRLAAARKAAAAAELEAGDGGD